MIALSSTFLLVSFQVPPPPPHLSPSSFPFLLSAAPLCPATPPSCLHPTSSLYSPSIPCLSSPHRLPSSAASCHHPASCPGVDYCPTNWGRYYSLLYYSQVLLVHTIQYMCHYAIIIVFFQGKCQETQE